MRLKYDLVVAILASIPLAPSYADYSKECQGFLNTKTEQGAYVYWENASTLRSKFLTEQALKDFYVRKFLGESIINRRLDFMARCQEEATFAETLNRSSWTKLVGGSSSGECFNYLRAECARDLKAGFDKYKVRDYISYRSGAHKLLTAPITQSLNDVARTEHILIVKDKDINDFRSEIQGIQVIELLDQEFNQVLQSHVFILRAHLTFDEVQRILVKDTKGHLDQRSGFITYKAPRRSEQHFFDELKLVNYEGNPEEMASEYRFEAAKSLAENYRIEINFPLFADLIRVVDLLNTAFDKGALHAVTEGWKLPSSENPYKDEFKVIMYVGRSGKDVELTLRNVAAILKSSNIEKATIALTQGDIRTRTQFSAYFDKSGRLGKTFYDDLNADKALATYAKKHRGMPSPDAIDFDAAIPDDMRAQPKLLPGQPSYRIKNGVLEEVK